MDEIASPATMNSRRIVRPRMASRTEEYVKHLKKLNSGFKNWLDQELVQDSKVDLCAGIRDYLDYSAELKDRYLRKNGEVLTFGTGDCGQLAHGVERDEDMLVRYPRLVRSLSGRNVVSISCGGLHNAIVTDLGQVYTWGCNDDGALGRSGDENFPGLVDTGSMSNQFIVSVSASDCQTVCVSSSGSCSFFGCFKSKSGDRFMPPMTSTDVTIQGIRKTPSPIYKLESDVELVTSGATHCLVKLKQGSILSFGLGECGQLGRLVCDLTHDDSKLSESDWLKQVLHQHVTPGLVFLCNGTTAVTHAKSIGCGAYHNLLVLVGDMSALAGSDVVACGLNNYGQLGLSSSSCSSCCYFQPVAALNGLGVYQVSGGLHHSLALSSTSLFAWGRGDYGQLGRIINNKQAGSFTSVPTQVPTQFHPISIACGSHHNLLLSSNGQVESFGYGEVFALGHGSDEDEWGPKRIVLKHAEVSQAVVLAISAGAQHSCLLACI